MSDQRENTVLYLQEILQQHRMPEKQISSAFSKMLSLTVCRQTVFLNALITPFLTKPISNKQSLLKTILITASAELLFMNSPDYAVINSYVNIAKKYTGKSCGGFINAVLHKIILNKEALKQRPPQHAFPDSYHQILQKDYDPETIKKIEQTVFQEPPLNITVKNNITDWAHRLSAEIVNNQTLSLHTTGKIENLAGYNEGEWWVQDTAAALAVPQFSTLERKRILDLCAAPGGKTAQLLNAGAIVTSLDNSPIRLKTLQDNLARLHLRPHKIICADILEYLDSSEEEPFDGILLDAPCSATGIFRRHPEVLHIKNVNDIDKQADLQQKILSQISPHLKVNGEFIYCTCSIAKDEGEKQIERFIKAHPEFTVSPLHNSSDPQCITPQGFIRTLPYHFAAGGGCDAFFIAKLTKKKA